jgi:hypothetical protein
MAELSPNKLVEDWGSFELLVAKLHETGSVTVEHDVTLIGESGAPRQIDVLIRHTEGLYEHLILVECKYWKSNVKRTQVDAMATAVRDLKASKGVIFTTKDFQSGAVTMAAASGVEVVKVREFSDEEWGHPGRFIDFYMQYFQRSIGEPNLTAGVQVMRDGSVPPTPSLHIQIGGEEGETDTSATPLVNADATPGDTLEKLIIRKSAEAMNQVIQGHHFDLGTGDEEVTQYAKVTVNVEPPTPLVVRVDGLYVMISKISFQLGLKIIQTRFKLDRKAQYEFAFAVESKVTGKVTEATRKRGEATTDLYPWMKIGVPAGEKAVENGSFMKFGLKGFFAFDEMLNGKMVERVSVIKPPDVAVSADTNSSESNLKLS